MARSQVRGGLVGRTICVFQFLRTATASTWRTQRADFHPRQFMQLGRVDSPGIGQVLAQVQQVFRLSISTDRIAGIILRPPDVD
jgi:hypothetical protein